MGFSSVTSKQNHFVKYALSLKEKKRRDLEHSCLIEGKKILSDLASRHHSLRYFFVSEKAYQESPEVAEKIAMRSGENFIVPDSIIQKLATTENSSGFIAVSETPIPSIWGFEPEPNGFYFLLDSIQDPGNCGTIFRTAAAFNVTGIILYGNCTDPYGPKAIRASLAETLFVPLYKISDPSDLRQLNGINLFSTASDAKIALPQFDFPLPLAVIMGNEGAGVSQELRNIVSGEIRIPFSGKIESLNLASASSIIAWEWFKRANS